MKLHVLGIDLGKTVFHLVGLDSSGSVVIRRKCSRKQLLAFTANLQVQLSKGTRCAQGSPQEVRSATRFHADHAA
jgi:transposase